MNTLRSLIAIIIVALGVLVLRTKEKEDTFLNTHNLYTIPKDTVYTPYNLTFNKSNVEKQEKLKAKKEFEKVREKVNKNREYIKMQVRIKNKTNN